ncbi:MAG: hypothetical protein AAGF97_14645 [Planctomycetota bacterium]
MTQDVRNHAAAVRTRWRSWATAVGLLAGCSLAAPTASAQFSAVQGSNRTLAGQSASLTLTPGVPGYIFDGQWRPFVTGVVPVVGSAVYVPVVANPVFVPPVPTTPVMISPLSRSIQRLQAGERPPPPRTASRSRSEAPPRASHGPPPTLSSAARGDVSLRVIRANQPPPPAQASDERLVQEAAQAEQAGKLYAARQLLRQAWKAAPPERQGEIKAEMGRVSRAIESEKRSLAQKRS